MAEKWPATIVLRKMIDEFTGGLIKTAHLADLDSQVRAPTEGYRWGVKL